MTDLFPDVRPGTDLERLALAVEAYGLDHLHRPSTVQEIEHARDVAHSEEYGALRDLALDLWATQPSTALEQILRWLPAFADQWARTEHAYTAALHHLALEQQ